MAGKPKHPGPSISPMALALRCRKLIQSSGYKATSCIETVYLIEQSALGMGLPIKRVVCQLQALYPAAAKAISQNEPLDTVWGTPGYWAVDVGHPEQPEDYVGMSSDRNHSVGIVPEPGFPEKPSQVGDIFLPHPPGRDGLQVANHSRRAFCDRDWGAIGCPDYSA